MAMMGGIGGVDEARSVVDQMEELKALQPASSNCECCLDERLRLVPLQQRRLAMLTPLAL